MLQLLLGSSGDPALLARSSVLPASLRLTGRSEPGQPLIVSGTVYGSDGKPASGVTVSVQQNRDGSRTVTETDRNGNVIRQRVEPKPVKKVKAPRKPGRAWASAYDPATGTRITSMSNGNGTRTVISFGPFGIGIGISR